MERPRIPKLGADRREGDLLHQLFRPTTKGERNVTFPETRVQEDISHPTEEAWVPLYWIVDGDERQVEVWTVPVIG